MPSFFRESSPGSVISLHSMEHFKILHIAVMDCQLETLLFLFILISVILSHSGHLSAANTL